MTSTTGQPNDDVQEFVCHLMGLKTRRLSGWSDADEIKSVTDTFRWLRNNSPRLNDNGKCRLLNSGLIETCSWYCDTFFTNDPLSRSVLLQFLANFSVGNETAQRQIFEGFCSTLRHFIVSSEDSKLLNNSMMLLYNLCLCDVNFRDEILKDVNIVQQIMIHWTQNEIEYSKIFLDSIFSSSKDFLLVYENLPGTSKDQLMNIISIWLDHYNEEVSLEVIVVIKNNFFINCALDKVTSHVVNVLAKASNIDKFNAEIKQDTTLLKKIMDLLVFIHKHAKDNDGSDNEFSRVKDLSALFDSDIQTHNRFWFKSDLIRLIANMCYNHQEHQHLMRTDNIIPILLECCSFDAKNPLMREWSLFALRNILEGNLDNQDFVANIDSVGSIDTESSVTLTDTLKMASIKNSISDSDTMFI
ncbi:ataxin-10 [Myzus persicae]|uniref:ataxin-10 n=1 Tax=Myzus persicae TaxID=13164 RepID=UPI000B934AFB|nr:ataxin-10 [Myzus persicae]XP_022173062.1 ataxin-10 [Myzus persicae]